MASSTLWRLCVALGIILLSIVSSLFGFWLRRHNTVAQTPRVSVNFLDIPDGDCTVILTPNNRCLLINAGGPNSGKIIVDALKKSKSSQIDLLVLATTTIDGYGGLHDILKAGYHIKSIWCSKALWRNTGCRTTLKEIQNHRIPLRTVHRGEAAEFGNHDAFLNVLWPPEHGQISLTDGLVCKLVYGQSSFLFLGSADGKTELNLLSSASASLSCIALQVTDHGSGNGSTMELLRKVQPSIAVIPTMRTSEPALATIERLQAAGASVWRTDLQGTVTITADKYSSPSFPPLVTGSRL